MTQRSKSQYATLYGSSGTVFPDNTTGEISEGDMRQFGQDQNDSLFNTTDDAYTGASPVATASGTNTYIATLAPAIAAYVTNQKVFINFTNANTAASTLNLNGLGAKSIVKKGSTAISAGDISAGEILCLVYDGTNFQIMSSPSNSITTSKTVHIVRALAEHSGATSGGSAVVQAAEMSDGDGVIMKIHVVGKDDSTNTGFGGEFTAIWTKGGGAWQKVGESGSPLTSDTGDTVSITTAESGGVITATLSTVGGASNASWSWVAYLTFRKA